MTKKRRMKLATLAFCALQSSLSLAGPVTGAVFTTVDPGIDGLGHCLNGGPNAGAGLVNCNIYDSKDSVWLSGGPSGNQPGLADGSYFFAVLVPGGQGGNENPNDTTTNNLSDLPGGDVWTNRQFTVTNGVISYSGTHTFDLTPNSQSQYGKIRLMPYDDTTNPGGVYILAVCSLAGADPQAANQPGVSPSDCKYDAFKILSGTTPPAQDLTIHVAETPTYDMAYQWQIQKGVDKKLVQQIGGTATFNYAVTVTHDAGTKSNWKLTGQITVSNPNLFDAGGVDVTDVVNDGGVCVVQNGTNVTVPGNGSVTLDYVCTYASEPNPLAGTDVATATWFEGVYEHISDSASFDFSAVSPNVIDGCVTVTDVFNTVATILGQVCLGGANPTVLNYNKTVPVPTFNCLSLINRASFSGQTTSLTSTAIQPARLCGPANTGGLTMGFWQNSNGQSIIKNNCNPTSGTSLHTFLTQFLSFADETATTCNSIATYIYNVIKAANASGASMNAMLKAQMLATALDVYFSDPALGGNKINAPAPIGSVSVDLTKICTDMTCTAFEDSSTVFGGSPKTVMQMLTYAGLQSTAGGILWYANVKTTQELAKDAFDAINNQKVFSP